jgi:hypothetical protein
MISFKEYFNTVLSEDDSDGSFRVNVVGTEDGEERSYSFSVDADSDDEARTMAEEKLNDMKSNGSAPDDASIQNIES